MKYKKFIGKVGLMKAKSILENSHIEAVYYVDEWSDKFHTHGYYADKLIVGVHNPNTHYRLDLIKYLVASIEKSGNI